MTFFRGLSARVKRARASAWGAFGARTARWDSAPRTPRQCPFSAFWPWIHAPIKLDLPLFYVLFVLFALCACRTSRSMERDSLINERISLASFDSLTIYAAAPLISQLPRAGSLLVDTQPREPAPSIPGSPAISPANPQLIPVAAVAARHAERRELDTHTQDNMRSERAPRSTASSTRERVLFYLSIVTLALMCVQAWRLRSRD